MFFYFSVRKFDLIVCRIWGINIVFKSSKNISKTNFITKKQWKIYSLSFTVLLLDRSRAVMSFGWRTFYHQGICFLGIFISNTYLQSLFIVERCLCHCIQQKMMCVKYLAWLASSIFFFYFKLSDFPIFNFTNAGFINQFNFVVSVVNNFE